MQFTESIGDKTHDIIIALVPLLYGNTSVDSCHNTHLEPTVVI